MRNYLLGGLLMLAVGGGCRMCCCPYDDCYPVVESHPMYDGPPAVNGPTDGPVEYQDDNGPPAPPADQQSRSGTPHLAKPSRAHQQPTY
jgi:hypothetical protein